MHYSYLCTYLETYLHTKYFVDLQEKIQARAQ